MDQNGERALRPPGQEKKMGQISLVKGEGLDYGWGDFNLSDTIIQKKRKAKRERPGNTSKKTEGQRKF